MSDSKQDIRSDEKEAVSNPQNPFQKLDEEKPFFDSSTSSEALAITHPDLLLSHSDVLGQDFHEKKLTIATVGQK